MLFLASVSRGPFDTKGINGGKISGGVSGYANEQKNKYGVPKVYRRAAKVERVACAIGDAISIFILHLCMYSTDTLHSSPVYIN